MRGTRKMRFPLRMDTAALQYAAFISMHGETFLIISGNIGVLVEATPLKCGIYSFEMWCSGYCTF